MGAVSCAPVPGELPEVSREKVREHLEVILPGRPGRFPLGICYQRTGGNDRRAWRWARWFRTLGVASAIVDNARMRKRRTNPSRSTYTGDAALAWDILKTHSRLDAARIALRPWSFPLCCLSFAADSE